MSVIHKYLYLTREKVTRGLKIFHTSIPKWLYFFPIFAAFAGILHLICNLSVSFADFMIEYVCLGVRFLLAKLTGWIPFSVGEMTLMLLPLAFIAMIVITVRLAIRFDTKIYCRTIAGLLSVIFLLYGLFVFTLAPGYKSSTLDQKLGMTQAPVSADELLFTAEILRDKAHALLDEVTFRLQSGRDERQAERCLRKGRRKV